MHHGKSFTALQVLIINYKELQIITYKLIQNGSQLIIISNY